MYLLSTNRAELRFFGTVEEAQYEGYAILSHVWNEKEQTFAETNRIARECEETGANPRDYSSEKVRESCIIAERYGHKWIWNDACCIDKGSSSELSEAINSMFTWYARAEVCYAYLQDVSRVAHLDGSGSWSGLEGSKWFERGWTLQELLAPAEVVFLSQCWEVIGTRARLSALLEEVTMIPRGVLTLEQDIQTISVARRMSWATRRATTRLEDEAYCLMGIFDINMPVLYGEGRKAFQRLQEEIMKKTADTTLFAWSDSSILQSLSVFDILLPRDLLKADSTNSEKWCLSLLASKPGDFCESSMIDFAPNAMQILCDVTSAGQNAEVHAKSITKSGPNTTMRPSFTMTPFGIEAHLPVVRIRDFAIALLFACRGSEQLGLFLTSRPVDTTSSSLYYACAGTNAGMWPVRMVSLSDILCEAPEHRTQVASAQWQNICFAHTPPTSMPRRSGMGILFPDEHSLSGPYYIPPRFLVPGRPLGWLEVLPFTPGHASPIAFALAFDGRHVNVEVFLGLCTARGGKETGNSSHWVNVSRPPGRNRYAEWDSEPPTHECSRHHIETWAGYKETFVINAAYDHMVRITLAFAPSPVNPTTTYILTELTYERTVKPSVHWDHIIYPYARGGSGPGRVVRMLSI